MPEPWLDLSTAPQERLTVRVDGEPHELPHLDDLSINERRSLGRWWARISEIDGSDGDLSDGDADERTALMQSCAQLMLPAVDVEAVRKLGGEQQEAVLTLFFGERQAAKLMRQLQRRPLPSMPNRRNGDRSSPGSSASTEETTPADG